MKRLKYYLLAFIILFFLGCEQQSETETPLACFSVSNDDASVGEIISFSNCSTNASNYLWDFGDGNTSGEISPTHAYEEAGQYVVKLTALNREKVHAESKVITVTGESTTVDACFTASATEINEGQSISFTNCSSNADSYSWTFGDGGSSSEVSPSHVFSEKGNYTVTLTAYLGTDSDQQQKQITVTSESTTVDACFTASATEISEGQSISFTNCSSNADSYSWDFGDGGSSSEVSPSHVFSVKGNYTVTLTAFSGSTSDQQRLQIIVNETAGTVTVEFFVQMRIEYLWGRFNYDVDYLDIAGNFNNWGETQIRLEKTEADGIYYAAISGFEVGNNLEYRFRINGNWETTEFSDGGSDRTYTVQVANNITEHWYNDVNIVTVIQDSFEGVPVNSYIPYFIEDFSSSPSAFTEGSDTYYVTSVHDGIYEVQSLHTEYDYLFWNDYEGPQENLNYEIEYSMKVTNYADTYGSGVFWGKNPDEFEYYFFLTSPDGYYKFGYYSSEWVYWIDWTTGANSVNNYNKITIRKLADNYYVFLNEVYLYEQSFAPFYGDKFGVSIGPLCTVEYDFLYIKMIDLDFGNNGKAQPININNYNSNPENSVGPKSVKRK